MSFKNTCCDTDVSKHISALEMKCLNETQKNLVKHFKKNKPLKRVILTQKDFDYGTYRITTPGLYVLAEDIVFHPNPGNNFQPTAKQIKSGLYPVPGPYNLNFFAAMTIEAENVIVDLNKHTIKQSKEHFLMQRFYANIELASAPFIGKQGPSPGISGGHRSGKKVAIINGTLGFSSHHGIHGNGSSEILLAGLEIKDFQVAGISLNGLTNSIFHNVTIKNALTEVPVLSSFSQCIFALPFVERLMQQKPGAVIYIQKKAKTIQEVYADLRGAIEKSRKQILTTGKTTNDLFHNKSGLSDTNMYGLSLNVNGVLVGGFLKKRGSGVEVGNKNIYVQDVTIENISSDTKEIVGLSDSSLLGEKQGGYGKGKPAITGPVGGLFDFKKYTGRGGNYISNPLGNAQAIVGLYSSAGTTYFTRTIIDWMSGDINIREVLADRNISEIYGADSMNHVMKGNIGFFVSGGENIVCKNLEVKDITNVAEFPRPNNVKHVKKEGEAAYTHVFVASKGVTVNGEKYDKDTFM